MGNEEIVKSYLYLDRNQLNFRILNIKKMFYLYIDRLKKFSYLKINYVRFILDFFFVMLIYQNIWIF